jgi:hypothetical protein
MDIARGLRTQSTTLICLGIGEDYNQDLLLKLYQANEGGQIEHITDPANQMRGIFAKISSDAKNVILSSTNLQVKLTKGVKIDGAYKIVPQVQELKYSATQEGNVLMFQVGDVIAGEGPELCMSFSLPERPAGEFREASFMVVGNTNISSAVVVNRTTDSELIRTRHDPLPEVKYREANEKSLALRVMQGEVPSTVLRQVITRYRNDPSKTRLMGLGHIQDLEKAVALSEKGQSADQAEVKVTKNLMTRRRGQQP